MKKYIQRTGIAALAIASLLHTACKKNAEFGSLSTGDYSDTTGSLKTSSSAMFSNIGMALTYNYALDAKTMGILKREVNNITFGNELKNESVVRGSNGAYDYTTADAFYNLASTNGIQVFGHTLVWHAQQNVTYLNTLLNALSTPSVPAPNLLANLNGGFEDGSGNSFTGWNNLAGGSSSATFSATAGNGSARALQVNVVTAGANAYDIQSIGPQYAVTAGRTINFSVDIKSTNTAGTVKVVIQNSGYQERIITTTGGNTWTTYTFSLTANEANPIIRLNFPSAGIYAIDNIVVQDPNQAVQGVGASAAQKAAVIDDAMKKYIVTTVQRYSGKIKAWDVVNEPFTDNGALRTPATYTIPAAKASSEFLYAQYIGSNKYDQNNYVVKAFQYAKAADPTITTFINDYNLEFSRAKVDSMVALVTYINKGGQLVDGLGTQMHINLGTNLSNIDYMFKRMASTGLKVRVSELDVVLNSGKAGTFTPDAITLSYQAAMYKYVVQSYIANVPANQRYGITVWGVTDTDSWLNTATSPDMPLLFDKSYMKKPAYAGFKQGLVTPM